MTKHAGRYAGAPHYSWGKGKEEKERASGHYILSEHTCGVKVSPRGAGEVKILGVRSYSHALLTWATARHLAPSDSDVAAWSAAGALLPDLPAIIGAVCLGVRHRGWFSRREFCEEACEKGPFGGPDAALHSSLAVVALLALRAAAVVRVRDPRGALLAFLLGWAGHVLAGALTHADDARPILWPLSKRRLTGPTSY